MKLILHIEGMKCPKCSARVEKALSALEIADSVRVSHETGIAEVTAKSVSDKSLIYSAVEKSGYKVTSAEQID